MLKICKVYFYDYATADRFFRRIRGAALLYWPKVADETDRWQVSWQTLK